MRRWHAAGWTIILLLLLQVFIFSGTCSATFPLPPKLDDTVWEGKYDLVTNEAYRSGTMVLTIFSDNGGLFRGKVVLDGSGTPLYMNGVILDGELHITLEEGTINARLVYDRVYSSPVWKMTGYWQDTGSHYPDRPRTIWFMLKKK